MRGSYSVTVRVKYYFSMFRFDKKYLQSLEEIKSYWILPFDFLWLNDHRWLELNCWCWKVWSCSGRLRSNSRFNRKTKSLLGKDSYFISHYCQSILILIGVTRIRSPSATEKIFVTKKRDPSERKDRSSRFLYKFLILRTSKSILKLIDGSFGA